MDNIDRKIEVKLESIFRPHATKRREAFVTSKGRFVHYTTAENAIKIIKSKKLWMRNAKCMNDYMEVSHGHKLLVDTFNKLNLKESLTKALEPCRNEIAETAIGLFNKWWNDIQHNTFISSISEHQNNEDLYGRLSMWRAYGRQSEKAAIVINVPFEPYNATKGLNLSLRPAAYFEEEDLEKELTLVINNIRDNIDFLSAQNSQIVMSRVFAMLVVTALNLKHVGFKEEREWRIIYLPEQNPSKLIKRDVETINGVPQIIYQVPLEDYPKENVVGISIPRLIDRIIIGPTQYPLPLYHAFKVALEEAGVENAGSRVIVSNIPLRT